MPNARGLDAGVNTPEECAQAAPHVGAQKCQGCVDAKEAGHGEARDDRPGGCRAHAKDFCCAHFNHNLKPETPDRASIPVGPRVDGRLCARRSSRTRCEPALAG